MTFISLARYTKNPQYEQARTIFFQSCYRKLQMFLVYSNTQKRCSAETLFARAAITGAHSFGAHGVNMLKHMAFVTQLTFFLSCPVVLVWCKGYASHTPLPRTTLLKTVHFLFFPFSLFRSFFCCVLFLFCSFLLSFSVCSSSSSTELQAREGTPDHLALGARVVHKSRATFGRKLRRTAYSATGRGSPPHQVSRSLSLSLSLSLSFCAHNPPTLSLFFFYGA